MKLPDYFSSFLTNTVNLNQTRLDQLDARVDAIVVCLGVDDVIGPLLVEHIPQGSWAHRTIIKPVNGREFDADFLLHLTERPEWSANPKSYVQQVRDAFGRSSSYKDKVRKKNRCVRIVYANDCHVDVVSYVVLADGRQMIVNSEENKFEDTNPQGFTDWMKDKDGLANGHLRKVIRLMKYVRDYKGTFSVPSVILTTLLGERVEAYQTDTRYSDVPTALLNVLADLDQWLQRYPTMPIIEDPSCPGTSFNHRWDQDRYEKFRKIINLYALWVEEAYHEADKAKSVEAWQRVFGPDFKAPVAAVSEAAMAKGAIRAPIDRAPREEFIEERALTRVGGHRARIDATVQKKDGFRHGSLRAMGKVGKNRWLDFRVTTDVPDPYELFWKVRNTGSEARTAGDLRGELLKDEGRRVRHEHTKYKGCHYVEAYVVKSGQLLASDHHDVMID